MNPMVILSFIQQTQAIQSLRPKSVIVANIPASLPIDVPPRSPESGRPPTDQSLIEYVKQKKKQVHNEMLVVGFRPVSQARKAGLCSRESSLDRLA